MTIFEFDFDGAKDWVAAPDQPEAEEFYLGYSGCGDLEGYTIAEIPKEKWGDFNIIDIDDPEPDDEEEYDESEYCSGFKIEQTFADFMAKGWLRCQIIATTEF